MDPAVQSLCVTLLLAFVLLAGRLERPELMRCCLPPSQLASFLAGLLLADRAAHSVTLANLLIVQGLLEHHPDPFLLLFLRHGVLHAVKNLAAKTQESAALASHGEDLSVAALGEGAAPPAAASAESSGGCSLKKLIREAAQRVLAHFAHTSAVEDTAIMLSLGQISSQLSSPDEEAHQQALTTLRELLLASEGVTAFEMTGSGTAKALSDFLFPAAADQGEEGGEASLSSYGQRLRLFLDCLVSPPGGAMVKLVRLCVDALQRVEHQPLTLFPTEGMGLDLAETTPLIRGPDVSGFNPKFKEVRENPVGQLSFDRKVMSNLNHSALSRGIARSEASALTGGDWHPGRRALDVPKALEARRYRSMELEQMPPAGPTTRTIRSPRSAKRWIPWMERKQHLCEIRSSEVMTDAEEGSVPAMGFQNTGTISKSHLHSEEYWANLLGNSGAVVIGPYSWLLSSGHFKLMVGLGILGNAVLLGSGMERPLGVPLWQILLVNLLLALGIVELFLHFQNYRSGASFDQPEDAAVLMMDAVGVAGCALELWVVPAAFALIGQGFVCPMTLVRRPELASSLLWLLRFPRILSMVPPLRNLSHSVFMALQGLLWVLVFLGIFIYALGIVFTRIIGDDRIMGKASLESPEVAEVRAMFSKVGTTMFYLFQITSQWSLQPLIPIFNADASLRFGFTLFYIYLGWVLLAVMTGTVSFIMISFKENLPSTDKTESEEMHRQYVNEMLQEMFAQLDKDGSGDLSHNEFKEILRSKELVFLLANDGDIKLSDLEDMWKWLDADLSGTVTMAEFNSGVARLSEQLGQKPLMRLCEKTSKEMKLVQRRLEALIDTSFNTAERKIGTALTKVHPILEQVQIILLTCQSLADQISAPTRSEERLRQDVYLPPVYLDEVEMKLGRQIDETLHRIGKFRAASVRMGANGASASSAGQINLRSLLMPFPGGEAPAEAGKAASRKAGGSPAESAGASSLGGEVSQAAAVSPAARLRNYLASKAAAVTRKRGPPSTGAFSSRGEAEGASPHGAVKTDDLLGMRSLDRAEHMVEALEAVLLVEPFAQVAALEDYVWDRHGHGATASSAASAASPASSSAAAGGEGLEARTRVRLTTKQPPPGRGPTAPSRGPSTSAETDGVPRSPLAVPVEAPGTVPSESPAQATQAQAEAAPAEVQPRKQMVRVFYNGQPLSSKMSVVQVLVGTCKPKSNGPEAIPATGSAPRPRLSAPAEGSRFLASTEDSSSDGEGATARRKHASSRNLFCGAIWGRVHHMTYELLSEQQLSEQTPRVEDKLLEQTEVSALTTLSLPLGPSIVATDFDVLVQSHSRVIASLATVTVECGSEGSSSSPTARGEASASSGSAEPAMQALTTMLQLLSAFHNICQFSRAVNHGIGGAADEEHFHCNSLTSTLLRQLSDPLAVCTGSIPPWCLKLAGACRFLFPFSVRRILHHSCNLGLGRALHHVQQRALAQHAHTQEAQRRLEGEVGVASVPRQKVRISRQRLLDSAVKVMNLYGAGNAILEVEYVGEVGTGSGPTLEFYAQVAEILRTSEPRLFREGTPGGMVFPYPWDPEWLRKGEAQAAQQILERFRLLGHVVAKCILDSRLVDVQIHPAFWRSVLGTAPFSQQSLRDIDPELFASLSGLRGLAHDAAALEAVCVDFTLPGHPQLELKAGGAAISLTSENLEEYVNRVAEVSLNEAVAPQIAAFRNAFQELLPLDACRIWSEKELASIIVGSSVTDGTFWTLEHLGAHIKAGSCFGWLFITYFFKQRELMGF
ncbi:unnamed protein product [Polarella glacialis]|uniref:Calmodulin n=1 Tax=Polarella glacialis TaxID=89957 RepID=A0A813D3L3_POLGL|nr:unnamed protein product [Polarella glacialis]